MSADEKKLNKDIADLFSEINTLVLQKRSLKKASVNEIKKGSVVIPYAMDKHGEFIVDKVFKNKDGETSYTGKFKKNGEHREFILHSKDRIVKESVNESDLKGYLVADVVDDIIKSIGTRFVSGEIKQSNKNKIYLKLKDVKFGSGVVKILKSRFGIDAKEEIFGGKDKFGSMPSVSFFANKVVSESVNEDKVHFKKEAFKILQSKTGSSGKPQVQRVFGKSATDK
jgi:hypothetical protein